MNDQNNLIDGLNTSQILVGLDLGTKTIGVAVSDRSKIIATPLSIIQRNFKGCNKGKIWTRGNGGVLIKVERWE